MTIYRDTTTISGVFITDTNITAAGERFTATRHNGAWRLVVHCYGGDTAPMNCPDSVLRRVARLEYQDGTAPKNRRNYTNALRVYNAIRRKGYDQTTAGELVRRCFDQFEQCPTGLGVDALAELIQPANS